MKFVDFDQAHVIFKNQAWYSMNLLFMTNL